MYCAWWNFRHRATGRITWARCISRCADSVRAFDGCPRIHHWRSDRGRKLRRKCARPDRLSGAFGYSRAGHDIAWNFPERDFGDFEDFVVGRDSPLRKALRAGRPDGESDIRCADFLAPMWAITSLYGADARGLTRRASSGRQALQHPIRRIYPPRRPVAVVRDSRREPTPAH